MTQPALQKALNIDSTIGRGERKTVRVCFLFMLLLKRCTLLNIFVDVCASTLTYFGLFKSFQYIISVISKRVWVALAPFFSPFLRLTYCTTRLVLTCSYHFR